MDQNAALVVGGALVVVLVAVLVFGSRLKSLAIKLGILSATVEGDGTRGPIVKNADIRGARNDTLAKGAGAEINKIKVDGDENKTRAES